MRLLFAATLLALHLSTPGLAAVETLDRGLVAGSVEGRVWSRVVDQVANTQGQAEIWHLGQPPIGASLQLIVDAPLATQLDIRIPWMTGDGGLVELLVSQDGYRTPTGFSFSVSSMSHADLNPDPIVVLHPRQVAMDVTYRLTVIWGGGTPETGSAPAAPERWNYGEPGNVQWVLELQRSGDALTLVFLRANGQEDSRLAATETGTTIEAQSSSRRVTIQRGIGYLEYRSANFDGSDPFVARLWQ